MYHSGRFYSFRRCLLVVCPGNQRRSHYRGTLDNMEKFIDCVVMKNSETGRSRGFGFVTFADPSKVDAVLKNGPHELDGRTIDPKACNPRSMQKQKRNGNWPKVFLGGLPSNLTETDLRNYFSRFGNVMEVVIMFDQEKKKSRGFGFLSFETDDAVERAVSEHFVNINGKQVEIKKAEPRDANKASDGSDGQWGSPPDSQWTMHSMGPPGIPGLNNGMGPSNMGPPMPPPLGPHNSQMGGPMGTQGIVQGPYQGWATPPQQQGYPPQGYGAPQGHQGYQGWGTGQQVPQWGAQYGSPGGQQFGSFGDPYHRSGPMNPLVTGAPGAPSPNIAAAAAAGPPGSGKANEDYSSWQGGKGPPV
ncbi:Heterogeneous nuclear ribonucleoprotein 27C [Armadillidium vulgare]|nr:Heterogeneous nuclear ribonucleoprotein 27C [Armadillidium vulgare]